MAWPDVVRLLAAAGIFAFHFAGDYARLTGEPWSQPAVFIESHLSYWSISAFVVLSGFVLGLGLLSRELGSYRAYAAKRLTRLYALYWTVAVLFILVGYAVGEAPLGTVWKVPVWLLGLGPVSPKTYLPLSQVWWYVSLALQISLLMPLVAWMCRRVGFLPAPILALLVNAGALAAVGFAPDRWNYLTQGLVFSRLAEVMIGVIAASIVLTRRSGGATVSRQVVSAAVLGAGASVLWWLGGALRRRSWSVSR